MNETPIERLAQALKNAHHIAVLSGAGMSTESGIPDFRSSSGIYNTITSEDVFDIDNFHDDPADFYRIMGPLYIAMLNAKPNRGHLALARLAQAFPEKTVEIATQNIDSLHQAAGSKNVYEVHGTLATLTCQECGRPYRMEDFRDAFTKGTVLRCTHDNCNGVLKPDITFFGESLPVDAFESAVAAFTSCDLALVLGTSLQVYPAAALPNQRKANVPLIIINKTPTPQDHHAMLCLHEGIGDCLEQAVSRICGERGSD